MWDKLLSEHCDLFLSKLVNNIMNSEKVTTVQFLLDCSTIPEVIEVHTAQWAKICDI